MTDNQRNVDATAVNNGVLKTIKMNVPTAEISSTPSSVNNGVLRTIKVNVPNAEISSTPSSVTTCVMSSTALPSSIPTKLSNLLPSASMMQFGSKSVPVICLQQSQVNNAASLSAVVRSLLSSSSNLSAEGSNIKTSSAEGVSNKNIGKISSKFLKPHITFSHPVLTGGKPCSAVLQPTALMVGDGAEGKCIVTYKVLKAGQKITEVNQPQKKNQQASQSSVGSNPMVSVINNNMIKTNLNPTSGRVMESSNIEAGLLRSILKERSTNGRNGRSQGNARREKVYVGKYITIGPDLAADSISSDASDVHTQLNKSAGMECNVEHSAWDIERLLSTAQHVVYSNNIGGNASNLNHSGTVSNLNSVKIIGSTSVGMSSKMEKCVPSSANYSSVDQPSNEPSDEELGLTLTCENVGNTVTPVEHQNDCTSDNSDVEEDEPVEDEQVEDEPVEDCETESSSETELDEQIDEEVKITSGSEVVGQTCEDASVKISSEIEAIDQTYEDGDGKTSSAARVVGPIIGVNNVKRSSEIIVIDQPEEDINLKSEVEEKVVISDIPVPVAIVSSEVLNKLTENSAELPTVNNRSMHNSIELPTGIKRVINILPTVKENRNVVKKSSAKVNEKPKRPVGRPRIKPHCAAEVCEPFASICGVSKELNATMNCSVRLEKFSLCKSSVNIKTLPDRFIGCVGEKKDLHGKGKSSPKKGFSGNSPIRISKEGVQTSSKVAVRKVIGSLPSSLYGMQDDKTVYALQCNTQLGRAVVAAASSSANKMLIVKKPLVSNTATKVKDESFTCLGSNVTATTKKFKLLRMLGSNNLYMVPCESSGAMTSPSISANPLQPSQPNSSTSNLGMSSVTEDTDEALSIKQEPAIEAGLTIPPDTGASDSVDIKNELDYGISGLGRFNTPSNRAERTNFFSSFGKETTSRSGRKRKPSVRLQDHVDIKPSPESLSKRVRGRKFSSPPAVNYSPLIEMGPVEEFTASSSQDRLPRHPQSERINRLKGKLQ